MNICSRPLSRPSKQKGARVFCFGSRARGDHKEFSDLDLLIDADAEKDLTSLAGKIEEELIEGNFPYKVDLVFKKNLAQSDSDKIEREFVRFRS